MTIGQKIKTFRKKRGLTQKRLSELTGIAEPNLRKYETDKQNPKKETLIRIANALKIQLSDLLTETQVETMHLSAANNGLLSMLEAVFETVQVVFHYVESDGVPEYDGDYSVYLTKGTAKITLSKHEFEALFGLVQKSIPTYVQLILSAGEE